MERQTICDYRHGGSIRVLEGGWRQVGASLRNAKHGRASWHKLEPKRCWSRDKTHDENSRPQYSTQIAQQTVMEMVIIRLSEEMNVITIRRTVMECRDSFTNAHN
jgi:hypothetical protein